MKLIVKAGGTIPTQNYGNYQPEYVIEHEYIGPYDVQTIEKEFLALREVVEKLYSERDRRFREIMEYKQEEAPVIETKPRPFKIRWYNVGEHVLPSVTSIINPYGLELDADMIEKGWTDEDISYYAMRGSMVHEQVQEYFEKKIWLDLKEHKNYKKLIEYRSKVILNPLDPEKCNFAGFWKKYEKDFQIEAVEMEVCNIPLKFAGRLDARGLYQGRQAVMDVKTSSSYKKEKLDDYFTQMAGYDIALGGHAEVYVVIPLNPSNKCGYGAPLVCETPSVYRERFLDKLKEFWEMPGIKEEEAKQIISAKELTKE